MELSGSNIKKFLIFQELELRERYIQNPSTFRTRIYLELQAYSEP